MTYEISSAHITWVNAHLGVVRRDVFLKWCRPLVPILRSWVPDEFVVESFRTGKLVRFLRSEDTSQNDPCYVSDPATALTIRIRIVP